MNQGILRIVTVDDDEPNLQLYRVLLERYVGCVTIAFTNPVAALAYCEHDQADAALIDFDMPQLDGVALARALRTQAHHARLPIIMVSGHLDDALRNEAQRAGVCKFVDKPFQRDTLLTAVSEALQA